MGAAVLVGAVLVTPACGDGAASEPDAGDGSDAAGTCSADDDCDDGAFCNGAERCAPDDPAADSGGCVAASAGPCDERCDEAADECGSCEVADADGDGHDAIECGGDDCDDSDPMRFPGNTEVCDEDDVDEDCDPETYGERDADGDMWVDGDCCNVDSSGERNCGPDCDDSEPGINPAVPEQCDGVDSNCDGEVPEVDVDADGDGVPACESFDTVADCNDGNADVLPGQTEYFSAPYCPDGSTAERVDGRWRCEGLPRAVVSFDYDCDGSETKQPSVQCTSRGDSCGGGCAGEGEINYDPSETECGDGVDQIAECRCERTGCVTEIGPSRMARLGCR